ncbi:hypothetical protein HQ571_03030 [Candidatus Kuenenbacteria bacterium]|nr:hypothetical protein [Candidatus Kuenenbacteria bacterium]
MGSGKEKNLYKTFVGQQASILEMIMSKTRKLADVVRWLQVMIAEANFIELLDEAEKKKKVLFAHVPMEVGLVSVPATEETFNSLDCFKKDIPWYSRRVRICDVRESFKSWFGSMDVGSFDGSILAYSTLTRDADDEEILSELGGAEMAETTLSEIWYLMLLQKGKDDEGALLTNVQPNIFYVRDNTGVLRTVYVEWHGDGWMVNAFTFNRGWKFIRRVFFRMPRPSGETDNAWEPVRS